MDWEDNTGPKCTEAQALELFERLVRAFSAHKFRDVVETSREYVKRFVQWPHAYAERGVDRVIDEQEFWPSAAVVVAAIRASWPPKNLSSSSREDDDGRGGGNRAAA